LSGSTDRLDYNSPQRMAYPYYLPSLYVYVSPCFSLVERQFGYLMAPPHTLHTMQQCLCMIEYLGGLEDDVSRIPIGPDSGVGTTRLVLELIGQKVAEPDAIRFGMLPRLGGAAIESMKNKNPKETTSGSIRGHHNTPPHTTQHHNGSVGLH
jgi:hypothetical protein